MVQRKAKGTPAMFDVAIAGGGVIGLSAAWVLANDGHRVLAVSYTHLDVYKRQARGNLLDRAPP